MLLGESVLWLQAKYMRLVRDPWSCIERVPVHVGVYFAGPAAT